MKIKKAQLTDFIPDEKNANKGTVRGQKMLQESLREDGAARSIVVDANNNVVAGNKTLENAVDIGIENAVVVETTGEELVITKRLDWDLYEDEAPRRYAYRDNRSSEVGLDWAPDIVRADIEKGVDLSSLFYDNELSDILNKVETPPGEDEPPPIDKAEELQKKWGTELGQVWGLGKHRLICGDCTDREVVERVMEGERVDMVFTDPPYNVSYQDNESVESLRKRNRRTDGLTISNDTMTDDDFFRFLIAALNNARLPEGKPFYLCAPPGYPETLFRNALNSVSGWSLRQCIVWVKNQFVFGRQDYHYRHESILYGWVEGAAHYFLDDRTQDTVWEIDRPRVSEFHPTMKPVELPTRAIKNSSRANDLIYDPFLGSGTTMVATNNLNRHCFGIEIDPSYVAVTLERMKGLGVEPILIKEPSG